MDCKMRNFVSLLQKLNININFDKKNLNIKQNLLFHKSKYSFSIFGDTQETIYELWHGLFCDLQPLELEFQLGDRLNRGLSFRAHI